MRPPARPRRLQVVESDVDSYGCAGVRVDVVESRCRYQGEVIAGRFRVTQTWSTPDGRPQLVAVQYTSAPAE